VAQVQGLGQLAPGELQSVGVGVQAWRGPEQVVSLHGLCASARVDAAVHHVAQHLGIGRRVAQVHALGVDEGVVQHQAGHGFRDVHARIVAVRHHVVGHHAAAVFKVTAAVAAVGRARTAPAQRDADALPRL
jgi:hypothetical protein